MARCRSSASASQDGNATRVQLGIRDFAVLVRVERLARLERRDLGLVDDEVEGDPVGFDPEPRVVVDREVAERVGEHDRRQHEDGEECEREGAAGGSHQVQLRHQRPGRIGAVVREERPGEGIVAGDVLAVDELVHRYALFSGCAPCGTVGASGRAYALGRRTDQWQRLHSGS